MFSSYPQVFLNELVKTVKKPWRIFNVFDKKLFYAWLWSFRPESGAVDWQNTDLGLKSRVYENYDDYIRHQKSKLDRFLLDWDNAWINKQNYDQRYREILRERVKPHIATSGLSTLCLAARLGTEVKAFIDLGCFAVGIDLNPGKENKYVVVGDFHNLQYADHSLDIVFTNSFDHVLYPEKILSEITRVLKVGGRFMTDLGGNVGQVEGDYETLSWSNAEEVISLIAKFNLKLVYQEDISYPFDGGKFLIFEKY